MYAGDNSDKLVPNGELSNQPATYTDNSLQPGGVNAQWCPGKHARAKRGGYQLDPGRAAVSLRKQLQSLQMSSGPECFSL